MDASFGLIVTLSTLAVLGVAYRYYRYRAQDGPLDDVLGQAVLAAVLIVLVVLLASEVGFARWVALGFGLVFGLIVMPVWVLAVLIPMRPGRLDVAFTLIYEALLVATVILAIAY